MASRRPFVVPVFLAHQGCPHRCVFCNQALITAQKPRLPDAKQFHRRVSEFLKHRGPGRGPVQIAFYGGNFLGLGEAEIKHLLGLARQWIKAGKADSIRFSTRPDTITTGNLGLLEGFAVRTIELGVQSMNDTVLTASARGHDAATTRRAAALIKKMLPDCELGIQLMVGLPRDTGQSALASARAVVELAPDFVRIYPTLVLDQSPLATLYRQGKYSPLALEEAVGLCARLYCIFRQNRIKVVRMGLQATDELRQPGTIIAGPFHPAFGQLVISGVCLETVLANLDGRPLKKLAAPPALESSLRGQHNSNLARLEKITGTPVPDIESDPGLAPDQLAVNGRPVRLCGEADQQPN